MAVFNLSSVFAARRVSPGGWILISVPAGVQLLILLLFSFELAVLPLLQVAAVLLLTTVLAQALAAYFRPRPPLRRRIGLALSLPALLYLLLQLQPANQYGVRPLTELRGAVNAAFRYEGLSQRLLHQKPEPPYALRTALFHKYRDEMPEHSWLISFYDEPAATPSAMQPPEQAFDTFYLFNLRNQRAGTNHPDMLNARLQQNPRRFVIDIAHQSGEYRYEIPMVYEQAQPVLVSGRALSETAGRATAAVYIHLTDPGRHSRFQQVYYRFLNLLYGPNPIS